MISTKGPVPLLVLAILFSIALFFAYKDLSAMRLRLSKLESDLPAQIHAAVEALSPPVETEVHAFDDGGAYAVFADVQEDLRDFVDEAAAAFGENAEDVGRWELEGDSPASQAVLEDITDVQPAGEAPSGAAEGGDVHVAVARKRATKKSA